MLCFFLIGDSQIAAENPLCDSSLTINPFLRIKCGKKGRYIIIQRATPDTMSSLILAEIAVFKRPLGKLKAGAMWGRIPTLLKLLSTK